MQFVNRGHLGGFVLQDEQYPHGDPMTYTPEIWEFLYQMMPFQSLIDVGCGQGHTVKWFTERGIAQAIGIEGCQEAVTASVARPDQIILHDFTTGPVPDLRVTHPALVWSCEFVEHVEAKYIENFLSVFEKGSVVAMTHAFPGQPGHHHVNNQESVYWLAKMIDRGFVLDILATETARKLGGPSHFRRSGLVFVKRSSPDQPVLY